MMQGLITFEGIDGCGKTTQLRLAVDWLREMGCAVCATREPGGTPLGGKIRELLLSGEEVPVPEAELLLFLADRAQHVRRTILPALQADQLVLCDRYSDSTRAYQMAARRLGHAQDLSPLIAFAECGVTPALTLWFDLPPAQAFARMRGREQSGAEGTRLDREHAAFHAAVAAAFARLHAECPARIQRIDAQGTIEQVQQRVRAALRAWLEARP